MNKYIIISIITSFLSLIGCKNEEEKFIKKNKVIYYNTKECTEFKNKAKISLDKAWINFPF